MHTPLTLKMALQMTFFLRSFCQNRKETTKYSHTPRQERVWKCTRLTPTATNQKSSFEWPSHISATFDVLFAKPQPHSFNFDACTHTIHTRHMKSLARTIVYTTAYNSSNILWWRVRERAIIHSRPTVKFIQFNLN